MLKIVKTVLCYAKYCNIFVSCSSYICKSF